MIVQAPPTSAATAIVINSIGQTPSDSSSGGPRPAVNAAPSRNWPSPPRFQRFARKATIRPAAIRSSGALRMMLS